MSTYEYADLLDDPDKIRILIDPTSSYARAAAMAMGRSMDDVIISAATGSANTGKAGTTSTALPSGQKIVHGSAGLTKAKLLSAKKILDANSVDPSIQRYMIVSPDQMEDLLGINEVASADFNTVRALVQGDVDTYMGFKFITSNRLGTDGDGNRQVLAFAGDGIKLAVGKDITSRIEERADKSFSTQIYYCMDIGATRMEEDKVVEIACTE
jgi:hypothetical protein